MKISLPQIPAVSIGLQGQRVPTGVGLLSRPAPPLRLEVERREATHCLYFVFFL